MFLENRISDTGVEYFLKAIQYQEVFMKLNISTRNSSSTSSSIMPSQGLLRLELQVKNSENSYERKRIYIFFLLKREMILFLMNVKHIYKYKIY